MGMVPEAPIAMLACARLGAPHTVVFGGFSADSLSDRLHDMGCEVLITQDEAWRRGSTVALKRTADEALADSPSVKKVLVAAAHRRRRADDRRAATTGGTSSRPTTRRARPSRWTPRTCSTCSTRRARPRSRRASRTRPAATSSASRRRTTTSSTSSPRRDVYWCAADVGWVTGHSYIVYGPLCNGATSVMYEGTPDFPDKDRWWEIVERYGVTILYTAPTAIRAHMKWGPEYAQQHDLSKLRLLGSVGEPINPEAWIWYHEHIGGGRCPIVDTWWQTETGMIMITPLPGITTTKPGSATRPFPGVDAAVYNEAGEEVGPGGGGYLVLRRPWPAMLRGIYGDDARYRETYWSKYTRHLLRRRRRADRRRRRLLAARPRRRRDERLRATASRRSRSSRALVDHHEVAEAAVAARNDAMTGQAIVAFVTLKGGDEGSVEKLEELRNHVAHEDRADREAGQHRLHARAAEDAQRQDHAPPAARRGREPAARRHDDARRPVGRRRAAHAPGGARRRG